MTKQEALKLLGLQDVVLTDKDIKKAYRLQVKLHHPDVVGVEGQDYFMRVQNAYEALCSGVYTSVGLKVTHSSIFNIVPV